MVLSVYCQLYFLLQEAERAGLTSGPGILLCCRHRQRAGGAAPRAGAPGAGARLAVRLLHARYPFAATHIKFLAHRTRVVAWQLSGDTAAERNSAALQASS